jgi:glycine/D-amino acid oxidase-like deaminating enzyme
MSKHYDVAVLGAGVGALTAAALLARRSWRVLVLGQGYRPPLYSFDGLSLARRTFTLLAGSSPAWGRVLAELAQSQTFRRRIEPLDPMLQVLSPRRALDLPPDQELFAREVDREFPEVRRVVDELYANLARTNAAADAAFERDIMWPPGTFWERRETQRVASTLPHLDAEGPDFFAEFPREHDYRDVVETPARFASDLATELPTFALARLHGAWTRGVVRLPKGETDLVDFLVERVRAHGGETKLGDRASAIIAPRGKVTGVCIDGDEDVTGVQFVVSDLPAQAALDLVPGHRTSRRARTSMPELSIPEGRFIVSFVVKNAGVPEALAAEAFLLPNRRGETTRRPVVHLQRLDGLSGAPGTTLLVAEALLAERGLLRPGDAREAVVETVEQFLPFVERHYLLVDSPHDGRPLWDFRTGKRHDVDRLQLRAGGGSLEAEGMVPRWAVSGGDLPAGQRGGGARGEGLGGGGVKGAGVGALSGEAIRMPLTGAFGVGRSVLPALGQEGELLAAWSASRLITRTDHRKEKMRREMWSKVELG